MKICMEKKEERKRNQGYCNYLNIDCRMKVLRISFLIFKN